MSPKAYDAAMAVITVAVFLVFLTVLLPVWGVTPWSDWARVAITAVILWMALAGIFSVLADRRPR